MSSRGTVGVGHPKFLAALRAYVAKHKPTVVFIFEPKISGVKAALIIRRLGFDSHVRVDAIGFAGGIWVLWKAASIDIQILSSSSQFIHMQASIQHQPDFLMTAVYGSPLAGRRDVLWAGLRSIIPTPDKAWLLVGDFNDMLSSADKKGGAPFSLRKHQGFIDCCLDCGLLDPGFNGPNFTWFTRRVRERLDRALLNSSWIQSFPETHVTHLLRVKSDHRPILISIGTRPPTMLQKPFRFFAGWLNHLNFQSFLRSNWPSREDFCSQISRLTPELRKWNREVFGNVFRKKEDISHRLSAAEAANEQNLSDVNEINEMMLRSELEEILWQEELF
ncbi:hypothetical protein LINPERHAP1_LOCUS30173 [Linum perenne]